MHPCRRRQHLAGLAGQAEAVRLQLLLIGPRALLVPVRVPILVFVPVPLSIPVPVPLLLPVAVRLPVPANLAPSGLLGAGWGLAGLCPGPAIGAVIVEPLAGGVFLAALALGMVVHRKAMG